jgi:hypothetical protein
VSNFYSSLWSFPFNGGASQPWERAQSLTVVRLTEIRPQKTSINRWSSRNSSYMQTRDRFVLLSIAQLPLWYRHRGLCPVGYLILFLSSAYLCTSSLAQQVGTRQAAGLNRQSLTSFSLSTLTCSCKTDRQQQERGRHARRGRKSRHHAGGQDSARL